MECGEITRKGSRTTCGVTASLPYVSLPSCGLCLSRFPKLTTALHNNKIMLVLTLGAKLLLWQTFSFRSTSFKLCFEVEMLWARRPDPYGFCDGRGYR